MPQSKIKKSWETGLKKIPEQKLLQIYINLLGRGGIVMPGL